MAEYESIFNATERQVACRLHVYTANAGPFVFTHEQDLLSMNVLSETTADDSNPFTGQLSANQLTVTFDNASQRLSSLAHSEGFTTVPGGINNFDSNEIFNALNYTHNTGSQLVNGINAVYTHDCLPNSNISSLTINGKTNITGTPTPSNPAVLTGIGNSGSLSIKTTDINLYDAATMPISNANYSDDVISLNVLQLSRFLPSNLMLVEPNTDYTIILDILSNTCSSDISLCTGPDFSIESYNGVSSVSLHGLTGKVAIHMHTKDIVDNKTGSLWFKSVDIGTGEFVFKLMVVAGTFGPYIPYAKGNVTIYTFPTPSALYSLSDGTADTSNVVTGVQWIRIGKKTLSNSDAWQLSSSQPTNTSYMRFDLTIGTMAKGSAVSCTRFKEVSAPATSIADNVITTDKNATNGLLCVYIQKSVLPSADLAGFKTWLTTAAPILLFKLASSYPINNATITVPFNDIHSSITANGGGLSVYYTKMTMTSSIYQLPLDGGVAYTLACLGDTGSSKAFIGNNKTSTVASGTTDVNLINYYLKLTNYNTFSTDVNTYFGLLNASSTFPLDLLYAQSVMGNTMLIKYKYAVQDIPEYVSFSPRYVGAFAKGMRIDVYMQGSIPNGDISTDICKGTFYITDISSSVDNIQTSITANDRLGKILKLTPPPIPATDNMHLQDFLLGLFTRLGIPSTDIVFNATDALIKMAYITGSTMGEQLRQLCQGYLINIFVGVDNKVYINNIFQVKTSSATVSAENGQLVDLTTPQSDLNAFDAINVAYHIPSISDDTTVLSSNDIEITAGTNFTDWYNLGSAIYSITYFTTDTKDVTLSWIQYTSGKARFEYSAAAAGKMSLNVVGKTVSFIDKELKWLIASGEVIPDVVTSPTDPQTDLQTQNILVDKNVLSIDSMYVSSYAMAKDIVQKILTYCKQRIPYITIAIRGNPTFKLYDCITVDAIDQYNINFVGYITRIQDTYDGFLNESIRLINKEGVAVQ